MDYSHKNIAQNQKAKILGKRAQNDQMRDCKGRYIVAKQPPMRKNHHFSVSSNESIIDTFYPNAIHCLLALYNDKFKNIQSLPLEQIGITNIWLEIEREMQESYFDFKAAEIKAKLIELREQYFSIRTQKDIESFEYFHQLHEIYHDLAIQAVLEGGAYATEPHNYKDEVLLTAVNNAGELDHDKECDIFENVQIKPEHITDESNSMRENDGGDVRIDETALISTKDVGTTENSTTPNPKRLRRVEEQLNTNINQHNNKKLKECDQEIDKKDCIPSPPADRMTLEQLNEHKERRHQEKMALWQKSLLLQERAIEIQQQLLQQLVNRL